MTVSGMSLTVRSASACSSAVSLVLRLEQGMYGSSGTDGGVPGDAGCIPWWVGSMYTMVGR